MPRVLRISPTLSPTVGVGASERSTMPNATPSSAATSRPISSPTRVTRKLVILISSARSPKVSFSLHGQAAPQGAADHARPGDADVDGGLGLAGAHVGPGHEGVVFGDVGEHDQLGAAEALRVSAVAAAMPQDDVAHLPTASMLMPARREATLTDAHTRSVCESTSGSESITTASPGVMPLWTRAVKPPTKSTPHSAAAASSVLATCTRGGVAVTGQERGGGRDRQPLVDHRDAVLGPHAVADLDQPAGPRDDLLPQLAAEMSTFGRGAIVEIQASVTVARRGARRAACGSWRGFRRCEAS